MKSIKYLLFTVCIALACSSAGASPSIDFVPLYLQAARKAATETAGNAFFDSAVSAGAKALFNEALENFLADTTITLPPPDMDIVVAPSDASLLSLSNAPDALSVADDIATLWQKLGLIEADKGTSPALAAALLARTTLEKSINNLPQDILPRLWVTRTDVYGAQILSSDRFFLLDQNDLYPEETPQGRFTFSQDLINYIMDNNNKLYTYLLAVHDPIIRGKITAHLDEFQREAQAQATHQPENPMILAAEQIPADADVVFLAEEHMKTSPKQLIPLFGVLQEKMGDRPIVVLTEFLTENYVMNFDRDKGILSEPKHQRLFPLLKALHEKNITVVGLEPAFANPPLASYPSPIPLLALFRTAKTGVEDRETTTLWESLEGLRIRNQHWLTVYNKVHAFYGKKPCIVFYTGYSHAAYSTPFTLSREIPGKTFVVEVMSHARDIFDNLVSPLQMPDCLKFPRRLGWISGFDVRVKLNELDD